MEGGGGEEYRKEREIKDRRQERLDFFMKLFVNQTFTFKRIKFNHFQMNWINFNFFLFTHKQNSTKVGPPLDILCTLRDMTQHLFFKYFYKYSINIKFTIFCAHLIWILT